MEITNKIASHIFRGYDIRGLYGTDLFENTAYTIGKAYGTCLKERFGGNKVLIGHDNRMSSPALSEALIEGVLSTGVDVLDLGLVTSPMVYYANEIYGIHAGIVVTASHSPKEYNGFKIAFDAKGEICGEEITTFRDFVMAGQFIEGKGTLSHIDIQDKYAMMLSSRFHFKKRLKVVVDSGNGTASIVVRDVFSKLNVEPEYIFCNSNPDFPNHHPDPAEAENMVDLQKKVIEVGADIGVAFDGDCDRVGCVDNKGNVLSSDYYMAIIATYLMPSIHPKKVIFDVSCSKTLSDAIRKAGGEPIVYKTGNSYIKREMLKQGMVFGGEISGHTFFKDKFYGFDDGIYAALRMMELIDTKQEPLSDMVERLPKYYSTPVLKITVEENKKALIVEKIKEYCLKKGYKTSTIDGARPEFEDSFAIIRMSNTSPKLTVRFEATTEERLQALQNEFMPLIRDYIKTC